MTFDHHDKPLTDFAEPSYWVKQQIVIACLWGVSNVVSIAGDWWVILEKNGKKGIFWTGCLKHYEYTAAIRTKKL